jgi:phosphoribosyl 1,2-cyclic phosphodiesterase
VPLKKIKQATNYGLSNISGCLLSHEHGDHAKAAKDIMAAGVDLYCSAGTAKALGLHGHRLHILKAGQQVHIPDTDWTVLPFEAIHDAEEPLGFLIGKRGERLLFATDTNYIPYRFRGLTHVMLGVDYDRDMLMTPENDRGRQIRTLNSHMSLQTARKFFEANDMSRVQEIYLLHLSDTNSDALAFRRDIERITGRPVTIAVREK